VHTHIPTCDLDAIARALRPRVLTFYEERRLARKRLTRGCRACGAASCASPDFIYVPPPLFGQHAATWPELGKACGDGLSCATCKTHDRTAKISVGVKLSFEFPRVSHSVAMSVGGGELRRGVKQRTDHAGRAMAPRTPSLAERLAEPWEGV